MSEIYGTTGTDDTGESRELGTVEVVPAQRTYGTSGAVSTLNTPESGGTSDVAKDEARATADQAKEGVRHVAAVGKDEAKNVAQETTQQAKELWQETRSQLMDQSAQQQVRVAGGLRTLSDELSGMARGSDQQGVASDLAHQASQRLGDVAGWLDGRDPGSLVSEVKQFARQRPGTFLAAAAVLGLVGGRLSRGLVAEHADSGDLPQGSDRPRDASASTTVPAVDHSTTGYSAYGSPADASQPGAGHPVSEGAEAWNASGVGTAGVRGIGTEDPR